MSAFLIITVEPIHSLTTPRLFPKIDRQYLSTELRKLWPNIEISFENDKTEQVRWLLDIQEQNGWRTLLDGEIFFSHDADCVTIDAHSSASYVAKFIHWYRSIIPQSYLLSIGNDFGGPEDTFDVISNMSETEIHNKVRDWVYD